MAAMFGSRQYLIQDPKERGHATMKMGQWLELRNNKLIQTVQQKVLRDPEPNRAPVVMLLHWSGVVQS